MTDSRHPPELLATIPAPMVPKNVDLRGFPNMQLDVLRLRDSELASVPDAEGFRVAVLSWCVAWHQVPAASLPNDEPTLARMLGFGRDMRGWKKARAAGGLRGWVLCSDGRLYHPVVAEKALEAWGWKSTSKRKREKDAERLRRWREGHNETRFETEDETRFVAERTERNGTENTTPPSSPTAARAIPATTATLAKRISGVDSHRVRDAVSRGDVLDLVTAFNGNRRGDRDSEWRRDTDSLELGVATAIFAWKRFMREPIREPSGFRKARAEWRTLAKSDRDEHIQRLLEFGLPVPKPSNGDAA